jgi:HEAT repeat protein
VRAAAALALGLRGGPSHVPLIVPLLKERDARVRLSALRALQRLHNPVAIDGLLVVARAETETEAGLRAEACTALGQYADRRAMQTLVGALRDDSLLVNRAALESLRTLTGQDLGDDQAAWLRLATAEADPFVGRKTYRYPIYTRDKYWFEWIPVFPAPPVEQPGTPAGLQPVGPDAGRAGPG